MMCRNISGMRPTTLSYVVNSIFKASTTRRTNPSEDEGHKLTSAKTKTLYIPALKLSILRGCT
jgi:hypothetical protein